MATMGGSWGTHPRWCEWSNFGCFEHLPPPLKTEEMEWQKVLMLSGHRAADTETRRHGDTVKTSHRGWHRGGCEETFLLSPLGLRSSDWLLMSLSREVTVLNPGIRTLVPCWPDPCPAKVDWEGWRNGPKPLSLQGEGKYLRQTFQ